MSRLWDFGALNNLKSATSNQLSPEGSDRMEHNLKKHPQVAFWEVIHSIWLFLRGRRSPEPRRLAAQAVCVEAVSEASPDAGQCSSKQGFVGD